MDAGMATGGARTRRPEDRALTMGIALRITCASSPREPNKVHANTLRPRRWGPRVTRMQSAYTTCARTAVQDPCAAATRNATDGFAETAVDTVRINQAEAHVRTTDIVPRAIATLPRERQKEFVPSRALRILSLNPLSTTLTLLSLSSHSPLTLLSLSQIPAHNTLPYMRCFFASRSA